MKSRSLIFAFMIGLGLLSGYSDIWILQQTGTFFSNLFINIFKCLSIPVISLSIIVTLAGFRQEVSAKTIWKRTLLYTFTTTFIAAAVSCSLYIILHPAMIHVQNTVNSALDAQKFDYVSHLTNLIPTSFFEPFLNQQVLGVLLVSVLVGLSAGLIPDEDARHTVIKFFRGMHGLLMVITRWVITIIPLGLS